MSDSNISAAIREIAASPGILTVEEKERLLSALTSNNEMHSEYRASVLLSAELYISKQVDHLKRSAQFEIGDLIIHTKTLRRARLIAKFEHRGHLEYLISLDEDENWIDSKSLVWAPINHTMLKRDNGTGIEFQIESPLFRGTEMSKWAQKSPYKFICTCPEFIFRDSWFNEKTY